MNSKYTFCLFFVSFLASCGMSEKEKVAVKIVQQTKIDKPKSLLSAIWGVDIEDPNRQQRTETWLDFANDFAKQNPNKRLSWSATTTEQNEIYKASFVDEEGWGTYWEVDIAHNIVRNINDNEYLSRKYGMTKFTGTKEYELVDLTVNRIEIIPERSGYPFKYKKRVTYVMDGTVINKTGRYITKASVDGFLKIIFKEKTIQGESTNESGFLTRISEEKPWMPNAKRKFKMRTTGIDKLYLNYQPEYAYFELLLQASDPTGYKFEQNLVEQDVRQTWTNMAQTVKR